MRACRDVVLVGVGIIGMLGIAGCSSLPHRRGGERWAERNRGAAPRTASPSVPGSPPLAAMNRPKLPAPPAQERPQLELPAAAALITAEGPPEEKTAPTPPTTDTARQPLQTLHRRAAERYASIESYMAGMRRRERVNGKTGALEDIAIRFRKQPWSVHLKWIGTEGKGREVLYVQGQHGNKVHTLLAPTDPGQFFGKIVALDPNSPLIRSRSRHPITEAGVGALIDRFAVLVAAQETGRSQTLKYLGQQQRPEADPPLETVEQLIAPGEEPLLPEGGHRWWFFDTVTHFPVLVITVDATGQEVEYYHYHRFTFDHLEDRDFDPALLWKNKK